MENIEKKQVKIKVIGVGGGGNNAAMRMIKDEVKNIEIYLLNTEKKILERANTKNVLQIGKETTRGLGAGSNAEVGEQSAWENEEDIKNILKDTDLLFLTAGMGGGTGTGAISVVAKIAKRMGILTIGIVTKPFLFEGKPRASRADIGISTLKENVNALIVVLNNNLLKVAKNNSIQEAFALADEVLKQGVQSITDLVSTVGEINLDFADLKTVFEYKGKAYMGIGKASGDNRVKNALEHAIENPLTENRIDKAKGVIFNVTGGENLTLTEVYEGANILSEKVDSDATILFGTVNDTSMGDEVRVTVIATGVE